MKWAEHLVPPREGRFVVVGGNGGIGRALTAALRELSCRVAVFDRASTLERHAVEAEIACPIDVTQESSVRAAFTRLNELWDGLEGLINLAGFAPDKGPLEDTSKDVWDEVVETNLSGAFLTCRSALPLLRRGRSP
jgi:NAD(P)-dependent dehydrogenase (short-subunit alcohol dehydrogenase family)